MPPVSSTDDGNARKRNPRSHRETQTQLTRSTRPTLRFPILPNTDATRVDAKNQLYILLPRFAGFYSKQAIYRVDSTVVSRVVISIAHSQLIPDVRLRKFSFDNPAVYKSTIFHRVTTSLISFCSIFRLARLWLTMFRVEAKFAIKWFLEKQQRSRSRQKHSMGTSPNKRSRKRRAANVVELA